MTTPSIEAVVAGSKGFALALLAPITERVGTRPRVASDPSQALAFCRNPGGLVVVEFVGEDSLRAIKDLVLQGNALRIVAAVSSAHAGAEEPLRALGVELATWDGKPDGVLGAVSRQLQAAARTAPVAAPARATPPPLRVAPTPPPPAQPARGNAPPAAQVRAPSAAAAAPVVGSERVPESPGEAASALGTGLFDDLGATDEFDVDVADAGAPTVVTPVVSVGAIWPANVPDATTAAEALARGLSGLFDPPGTPLGSVADVVGALSELERAVLAEEPQPVDGGPIRRAAVMRVRVAAALATAPAEGGAVDAGAVSAFLAEIDALLSDVNALAASAPAELQPALEAIRNSLVKEAIDFSEASQRGIPAVIAAAPAVATRAVRETRVVSVASKAETEIEEAQSRRQRKWYVALAVSVVVAAAFHGYRFWRASTIPLEPPTRSGMPANTVVVSGTTGRETSVLKSKDGAAFSPEDVKRLEVEESLKGNTVREVAKGVVVIIPGAQAAPSAPPAPAAR